MEDISDKELFDRIRKDDRIAYKALFTRHYKVLLGTAINMLKEVEPAKDMVQEVFYQIWKNRHTIEITSAVAPYLKRSVINRSLNLIRSRKPLSGEEALVQNASNAPTPIEEAFLKDLETALEKALEQLPERCRLVFVMKRFEGLSQKEIAQSLNISTKTVENQITKAVKFLKITLAEFRKKEEGNRGN